MMQRFEGKSWEYTFVCDAGVGSGYGAVRQHLLTVHPQPLGARAVSDQWHERQVFFTQSYVFNLHIPVRCIL